MKVYRSIGALPMGGGPRCIAIGVFDGVHQGHQAVIHAAVEAAQRRSTPSMVITFTPNPLAVLRPELKITEITDRDTRAAYIADLGATELLELPFTPGFSRIPAGRFCEMLTSPPIDAIAISVGENFRFGHGGEGTTAQLREFARSRGIELLNPHFISSADGKPISSTRIRRLISQGSVADVAELLGRPHRIRGIVVQGDGRGSGLGIPTANLAVGGRMATPGKGVYAARVYRGDDWWPAAVNIGTAPTFRTENDVRIEAFLLDFDGSDLYDTTLTVEFIERIRPEQRFSGPDDLVSQIRRDIESTRAIVRGERNLT